MKKKQILIVEDERIEAEDIKMSLQKLGYAVSGTAFSGMGAITKAEKLHPDLVLMDIVLGGKMDGIEAASIINSRLDIPVIYLTAHSDKKMLKRAKATEPFGYIHKPFENKDLKTTIEMALHNHEMANMLKESEERYRSLVENAHDAIYISTSNGFKYANPAFENLTDWKKEELCNKEFNFWNIVHPDDKKLIKEKKEARKKGKEIQGRFEFRITTKDGGERIVEANTVNIGKQGEVEEMGILRDITVRKKAEEELIKSLERYQKTFEQTINALVSALERRDPYTAGHQKRVANLAYAIAREMDLPEEQVEGVRMAGLIHDVGKIQIPTEILIKPDHLSEIEFVMIKMHPQIGYEIVQSIEFPYPVAMIVLQHHERMDGSGYPSGLFGEHILPEAKILAVADIVEAMSSHRPYRPALGIGKALEEISKHKGFLYDPGPVNACLKLFYEKKFKLE
ncbi:MAG TPA: PAS domain S-box protein [Candidatus Aminicenantes bacterium]|nr:PAS domain S-box protein [Candidatus Aminicenantes bacterium]HEB35841.1 PAS domain S-box protein [Candidatus Aminicenantes bacterium]